MRPELPPLPPRIASLPVDKRGYPVPWFVAWVNGEPEFRMMDPEKFRDALRFHRCWVCGEKRGARMTFVIGPMCAITRTTSEPPCHPECAEWSVRACPFLTRPHMVRREDEFTEAHGGNVAGRMISRNPGVSCLWTTREFRLFGDGQGKTLLSVGTPERVGWWREGRAATRAEVLASIDTGIPKLFEVCQSAEETAALEAARDRVVALLPA